jgi:chemotaxis protein histidine kinase CheA
LERKSAGKDPKGQLTLTAYKKEGYTYISAADDGRGLSADKIRAAAVEKGLLTQPAAAALSDADAYQLILRPGFSTAGEATEISGRGVGMDVVKAAVEELGGEVIIETELGRGTVFTYRIPQLSAVNIVDALIIRADDDYYTAPIGNVAATHAFQPGELHSTMNKGRAILYLGALVPLYDIKELLTGRPLDSAEIAESNIPVIIIDGKNGRIALQVTEFIRPQKLVLIPLPEIFSVKGVSGATILGGNQLGLVLDPFELINLATGAHMEASDNVFLSRETVAFEDEAASAPPEAAPAPEAPVQTESMAPPAAEDAEVGGRLAEEFFLEIQGILTELNEDVFQLEKDPENQRRINTIFRHFHSIKGNLIMTGFSALGDFVHKVETVLDRMREKELAVNQEIIDLLLDTVKHLEQALKEIRAGRTYEIDDEDLVGAVEKYRRTEKPPEEPVEEAGEGAFQMSPLSQLLLQSKTMQGANIFQSMIRVKPRFQEPFLAAYLILRRMALLGDVIDAVPPLSRIEQGLVGETIKVLFASRHSLDEVNRFMERQLKRHFDVVEYENLLME